MSRILNKKFHLKSSIRKVTQNQWIIYIWKESMPILISIVESYIIDEMKYKFIDHI